MVDVQRSHQSHHLLMRIPSGKTIPDFLLALLRDERVGCGWLRASGVVADVELRLYDADVGALGRARHIEGPVHALVLEGSIGLRDGTPSLSLRALLAREAEWGPQALCGEIAAARVVALEAWVTVLDDVSLERVLDEAGGVHLLGLPAAPGPAREVGRSRPLTSAWSGALAASEAAEAELRPHAPHATQTAAAIPARPKRPHRNWDAALPEAGDVVDHFAFGRCEVIKSDGDRLRVKVHRDGRIREIVLGMLLVSPLADSDGSKRRFKLERKM